MANALIEIVDGGYPTFVLGKNKIEAVKVKIAGEQLKLWKAGIKEYQRVQKEMHEAVDHYEPFRLVPVKSKSGTSKLKA